METTPLLLCYQRPLSYCTIWAWSALLQEKMSHAQHTQNLSKSRSDKDKSLPRSSLLVMVTSLTSGHWSGRSYVNKHDPTLYSQANSTYDICRGVRLLCLPKSNDHQINQIFCRSLLCAGQIKIFKRISWVQMFHIIPGLGQYLMFLGFFFFFFLFFFTFPIGKGVLVGMVVLAERKNVCIYPFQSLYYCQLQLELKSI